MNINKGVPGFMKILYLNFYAACALQAQHTSGLRGFFSKDVTSSAGHIVQNLLLELRQGVVVHYSRVIGSIVMLLLTVGSALATEPLYDKLLYKGQTGPIFQPGVGWLDLPHSERLQILRRESQCSAIGGPRGIYKYENGRLWITGLHRCGGEVALDRAYPEMQNPSLAVWVSGKLIAKLGNVVCTKSAGGWVFQSELTLDVELGVVTALSEKENSASACP